MNKKAKKRIFNTVIETSSEHCIAAGGSTVKY
ncbi:hypothetical protein pEaSNUABM12_00481 [Erwinia phage pEa_SNUABM_12]|uniref:Uncharacterized protein n=1 Tax=Erwinia phage pEa_SNUABM_12 TaxID=2768773 RepID=A0A7L8ZMG8_9CAUD|nr:hypothetical protein pEaSNUABM12_00481 [Erwinia phage pEa_SNUABM_12]